MVFLRLALRLDRRFAVAALGAGMAILVPVAGTLVLAGLSPDLEAGAGWLVLAEPGGTVAVREDGGPIAAVVYIDGEGAGDGTRFVVPLRGEGPPAGTAWTARPDAETVAWGGRTLRLEAHAPIPLAGSDDIVVPATGGSLAHAVLYGRQVPGAVPAHGADAFEWAGVEDLKRSTGFLVAASVPLVVFVAAAFADQDARRHTHTAATFSALGRPDVGRRLVAVRAALVAVLGAAVATVIGALLWWKGGATFHPVDTPRDVLALAIAGPAAAGAVVGVWLGVRRVGNANAQLRGHPAPPRSWRVPLPLLWRPLLMGSRVAPALVLAALLFVLDVGFPMAAAAVPASVAGSDGELVEGAESDIVTGARTDASRGHVLRHHPDVEASIAEILLPTMVEGHAVLLRGGHWEEFQEYYDLRLRGEADGLVLGERAARRMGLERGDLVRVQATYRADAVPVEVTGILRGQRVLEDEGVLPEALARQLGELPPGKATVVRVRPDTAAAEAALASTQGRIEVLSVAVGGDARESTLVPIAIRVVNVGGGAAERLLAVRIGGSVVDEVPVRLSAFTEATLDVQVLVPPGGGDVTVNPTQPTEAEANPVRIEVPGTPFSNESVTVLVHGMDEGVVRAFGSIDAWTSGSDPLASAAVTGGQVSLAVPRPGDVVLVAGDGEAVLRTTFLDAGSRDAGRVVVRHVWIDGSHVVGRMTVLHAEVQNLGGAVATEAIDFYVDDARLAVHDVTLAPGERTDIQLPFLFQEGRVRVEDRNMTTAAAKEEASAQDAAPASPPSPSRVTGSVQLREAIADRVLGDARQALGGLGAVALASSLSIVYLGTDRALGERDHVRMLLGSLGRQPADLRRRVAWEAAVMGALALVVGILAGSLLFLALGALGWPAPFAHSIRVPFGPVFVVRAAAIFGGACAMAAYLALGERDEHAA